MTSVVVNADGSYTLTGTQISGLINGADEGDDMTMAENYPIVWLTDEAGNVYYCRSFDFSNMMPSKGSAPETCQFTTPKNLPEGTYNLYVSAVGVQSKTAVTFTPGVGGHGQRRRGSRRRRCRRVRRRLIDGRRRDHAHWRKSELEQRRDGRRWNRSGHGRGRRERSGQRWREPDRGPAVERVRMPCGRRSVAKRGRGPLVVGGLLLGGTASSRREPSVAYRDLKPRRALHPPNPAFRLVELRARGFVARLALAGRRSVRCRPRGRAPGSATVADSGALARAGSVGVVDASAPSGGDGAPVVARQSYALTVASVDTTFVTEDHFIASVEMQLSGEPFAEAMGRDLGGYSRDYVCQGSRLLAEHLLRPRAAPAATAVRSVASISPAFRRAVESYEYSKQPMNNIAFESGAGTSLALRAGAQPDRRDRRRRARGARAELVQHMAGESNATHALRDRATSRRQPARLARPLADAAAVLVRGTRPSQPTQRDDRLLDQLRRRPGR